MKKTSLQDIKNISCFMSPAIVVCIKNFMLVHANQAALDLGIPWSEESDNFFLDDGWPDFVDQDKKLIEKKKTILLDFCKKSKTVKDISVWGIKKSDSLNFFWFHVNATPVFIDSSESYLLVVFEDITKLVSYTHKMKNTEAILKKIFDNTPMGMCITNEFGYFELMNDAYLSLYGYSREEMLGKHFTLVVPEENRQFLSDLHDKFIFEGTEIRGKWDVVDKKGNSKSILADATLITGQDGRPKKVTFVIDISKETKYELMLKDLAVRDPLTGLFNRRYLFEQLEKEAVHYRRYDVLFSIFILDIDHFKKINDNYGHIIGDEILAGLAEMMRDEFREADTLCRYGGEEFLVIMPETFLEAATSGAERFRKKVECKKFSEEINITISGGVKEYRGGSLNNFIKDVDALLYNSKSHGRNMISA